MNFVLSRLGDFEHWVAPQLVLPQSYAGHPVRDDARADLLYVMGLLIEAGIDELNGVVLHERAVQLLREISPADVEGFYSYRVADTVIRLGGLSSLPVDASALALSASKSRRLVAELRESPAARRRNWSFVATRCLWSLSQLEMHGSADLDLFVDRARGLLETSDTGWINDGLAPWAQYDIYTPEMYLLSEPFESEIGRAWGVGFARVMHDLDCLGQRAGAIVWGRSVGALSLAMGVQVGAHALVRTGGDGQSRWLARVRLHVSDMEQWFSRGVISAHQNRSTDPYRSTSRRLQMTLDVLGKMLLAASVLRFNAESYAEARRAMPAWPDVDRLVRFDSGAPFSAWAYRSRALTFVLPVLHGPTADYLASPRYPGMFDQAVVGPPTLVPAVVVDHVGGHPTAQEPAVPRHVRSVAHAAGTLCVRQEQWAPATATSQSDKAAVVDGSRLAYYRIDRRKLEVHEHLTFDRNLSGSVVLLVGDSPRQPLRLSVQPHGKVTTIDVSGIAEWRSHWGAATRVQQVEIDVAADVEFTWSVTRGLRIASTDYDHDYGRALYVPMAHEAVVISAGEPDSGLRARLEEVDILHLAWPERWCGVDPGVTARVIDQVRASDCKLALTQHNLVPHRHKDRGGFDSYSLWAEAADLVIHHSEYGHRVATQTHVYGTNTKHVVIPHGAWSDHYSPYRTVVRSEVEREERWESGRLRLAVIGQPRAEKDIQSVLDAVVMSKRHDLHLVARVGSGVTCDDPRVTLEYGHLPDRRYRRRMTAIDAVILPFASEGMLATGTVFDCIGSGVPAITSSWGYLREVLGSAAIEYGRSADDLSRCIDALTPEMLERARAATVKLRDLYQWEDIARRTLKEFEELA
jgi:glycosyltransferase involved in cell wall biosynthesis